MLRIKNTIFNIFFTLFFVVSCNIWGASTNKFSKSSSLSFVLTNNPSPGEVGINLGCRYKATPAFTNPADPEGTRLLDKDIPYNWNTTAGVCCKEQNIVFDLKSNCRIDMMTMLFDTPQKPSYVEIFVGNTSKGPWESMGKLFQETQTDKWWQIKLNGISGRYIKILHRVNKWGWYLREVKIYGNILTKNSNFKTELVNGKLLLVKDGISFSTIVVSDQPSSRVLEAACAFQDIARRITGVWIPIVSESSYDKKSIPIYIGDSIIVRKRGINVKQDASDGDHYIIKSTNNYLALVGNDAPEYGERFLRSSVYAVYNIFEKIGCGWFGPDPLWHVIPENKTLSIPLLDIEERPAFLWRHAWMHRMNSNELRDAWREGGIVRGGGHAYNRLVPPEKYKKLHPDWFGEGQPDITNPEVIKMVTAELRKQIDEVPAPIVVPFSFSSNDTGGYVENERTKEIGNISAQQLYFANEVAKGLNKTHYGRFRLYCLAYWHSHEPPKPVLKAEPGVHIVIVNEGDHTKPLDKHESLERARTTARNNTREVTAIAGWRKTKALTGVYEWYIPTIGNKVWRDLPWYPGELTLRNLRYWHSRGIRYVFYETQGENNGGFPLRWPVYYQCYRGMWNPKLTAREIMKEACTKLFGPAANAMMNYYAVFEKAMMKTDEYVGNWHLPSPEKVYTQAVEKQADKWIEMATVKVASCNDGKIKKRIEQELALWNTAKSALEKLRNKKEKTYKIVLDGKSMKYKQSTVTLSTLISLYGLPYNVKIDIIEKDGQNRRLKAGAKIDLHQGTVFKTVK